MLPVVDYLDSAPRLLKSTAIFRQLGSDEGDQCPGGESSGSQLSPQKDHDLLEYMTSELRALHPSPS